MDRPVPDYGKLEKSFAPKMSACITYCSLSLLMLLIACGCVYLCIHFQADGLFELVEMIMVGLTALFLIYAAGSLAEFNFPAWRRSRLEFYENGAIYRTSRDVYAFTSADIMNIVPVSSYKGAFYCLVLTGDRYVLIAVRLFGREIETYLSALMPTPPAPSPSLS